MKKINILGRKYSVKIKPTSTNGHAAEYCTFKKEIIIDPDYERKTHSLGHELGHLFWEEVGLNQIDKLQDLEEVFCQLMGALLEDNITTLYQMHNKLSEKPKKK